MVSNIERFHCAKWLSLPHNFIQLSLNSTSAHVQILLTACQRFAMVRISDNGPILLVNQSAETSDHCQGNDYSLKWRGRTDNVIITQLQVTRNGQSGNTGRLNRNLYVMLKLTERPKTPGMTSKKKVLSLKGVRSFAGDCVIIWMKQRLIWFNLQRDGTRNGLSNIKETFAENLQLKMSVLCTKV